MNTIIIADDDRDDKEFFDTAIKEFNPGAKIFNVPNGLELMKLLESFLPDILFLDLDMPYKNGLECLVELRNNEKFESLPVVVFSSTNRPANIQTAYEMGAHLFFIKPSEYREYIISLKAILQLDWREPAAVREKYCVNGRYTAFG